MFNIYLYLTLYILYDLNLMILSISNIILSNIIYLYHNIYMLIPCARSEVLMASAQTDVSKLSGALAARRGEGGNEWEPSVSNDGCIYIYIYTYTYTYTYTSI